MGTINIKAILGISPCKKPKPHFFTITRGATAELRYDLYNKWFRFRDLEQLTFTFKQNKKLYWFNMFIYFIRSTDTEVDQNKSYYTIETFKVGSREVIATLVENPSGDPSSDDNWYYEITTPTDSQNDLYYSIDNKHFYREFNYQEGYDYISFILSSDETKQFKSTSGKPSLLFETTVRINTDDEEELALRDSVIVEPHPPIVVVNCLYSQID